LAVTNRPVILSVCLALSAGFTFAAPGRLDPAFGNGGIVQPNLGGGTSFNFAGIALAPNGDIVVGGSVRNASSVIEASIARYLSDGSPDPSFGVGGIVTLPPPANFFLGTSIIQAVTVQPDRKILALYFAFNNTSTASENTLIRLNVDGSFDSSFGNGGQVVLNFPAPATFAASATMILAHPDGRILLSGNVTPPFRNHSAPLTLLARYLSTGAPDSSFGTNGISEQVTPVDLPVSLALLAGDGLLAANAQGQVAQFSSSGTLLPVSTGGTVIATESAGLSAFQQNADYVLGETAAGPQGFKNNQDAVARRFLPSGAADASFASPLIAFGPNAPLVHNIPIGIGVDSEGRVVIGVEFESSTEASGVARLNADGTLDSTFGKGGIGVTIPGFNAFGLVVQPNNDVILVSGGGTLARILAE
jgi:uncharacterized delta-60 repeat protein